eukprot:scpid53893/ scgid23752/ Kelch domain-containing protein 4
MGKKKKSEEKRGRAQEKAAQKADKKQKSKKGEGEEDFDAILKEIRELDAKRTAVTETKCPPPSPRCFGSLVAHPEKQELLLFGGEFFDGRQTSCYNDLFIYNIRHDEWIKWDVPNPPPPRSSHQAACVPQGGGQMWLFGGEFTSANNESFHHFRDLWMLDLAHAKWENVKAPGGPSSRSGHRMVVANKHLIVFGGFHEKPRDFLYFNDVYAFSLQSRVWHRINAAGGPSPRSAACLSTTPRGALLVIGGYSRQKVKRDGAQKPVILADAWSLVPLDTPSASSEAAKAASSSKKPATKKAEAGLRWKWAKINPSGQGPGARSGATTIQLTEKRALLFGGSEDVDKDEEGLQSQFLADMYQLATDGKPPRWFEVNVDELSRQAGGPKVKRRRKKKPASQESKAASASAADAAQDEADNSDDDESEYETDTDDEDEEDADANDGQDQSNPSPDPSSSAVASEQATSGDGVSTDGNVVTVCPDSVFTVVMKKADPARQSAAAASAESKDKQAAGDGSEAAADICAGPIPRISASLATKGGTVFVYGGMYEQGDRQVYLDDMYSLDILRRGGGSGGWKCLVALKSESLPWLEVDEEEEEDEDEEEEEEADEDEENSDDGEDATAASKAGDGEQSDEEEEEDGSDEEGEIQVNEGEGMGEFYIRTKEQWLVKADMSFEADHDGDDIDEEAREKAVKALAFQMAKAAHKAASS